MTCPICEKEIKQDDTGCMVAFGYWKVVDDADPDRNDFDPIGEEYDLCSDCTDRIGRFIDNLIKVNANIKARGEAG